MMGLNGGNTIMKIAVECQKEFQQKYYGMKTSDWLNLLSDYVRKVTERPTLKDEEAFRFVMAG
jgi:type I restriction enzyme R subunit